MNEIKIFNHPEFGEIRTAGTSENPLFCLKDVCRALVLNQPSRVKSRLDRDGVTSIKVIDSLGRGQMTSFINEKNLYRVIMRSEKQEALMFQNWVCDEVLPSIRKHGMYATDTTLEQLISSPDFGIQLLTKLKEERAVRIRETELHKQERELRLRETELRKQAENERLQLSDAHQSLVQEMNRIAPLADYCKQVLASKDVVTVTQIAQDYGYSAKAFNQLLRDLGIQFRRNDQWILYGHLKEKGYVQSETISYWKPNGTLGTNMYTKWTQSGRLFLYQELKAQGYLPLMEQSFVEKMLNRI